MLNLRSITPSSIPASAIERHARAASRRRELISTLRHVARLASEEHFDELSSAQRARWAQMVAKVDAQLRRLCNPANSRRTA